MLCNQQSLVTRTINEQVLFQGFARLQNQARQKAIVSRYHPGDVGLPVLNGKTRNAVLPQQAGKLHGIDVIAVVERKRVLRGVQGFGREMSLGYQALGGDQVVEGFFNTTTSPALRQIPGGIFQGQAKGCK